MERRNYLQIPGPTNVPNRILHTLSRELVNHRGDEFKALVEKSVKGLKEIYRTKNDILIFPSSGTGALESTVANLFSHGDRVLVSSMGVFSERYAKIAENFGLDVIRVEKDWGLSLKPEDIREELEKDREGKIKAVCLPHNETTSGIENDIEGISKVIEELNHPALLVVDAVSSLASLPLETDKWNIDVVVAGSQKGLMLPPGLGIVSVSDKAWEAVEKSDLPKFYWDYKQLKARMDINQFPYTPAMSIFFGLGESIDIIREEGLENVWERHRRMGLAVRNAAKAMGLKLLAEEGYESNTTTAVYLPEGIDIAELFKLLSSKYNVVLGGGLQKLQGKIFRIGHLGSIHELDIYAVMGAIEMSLYELGYDLELGSAAIAMSKTFLQ